MAVALAALCACGGRLVGGEDDNIVDGQAADAATNDSFTSSDALTFPPTPDAKPPKPPSSCGDTTLQINSDPNNDLCTLSETWTCSSDQYEVRCNCPEETCECLRNDHQLKTIGVYGLCPSCSSGTDFIALCPFPH